MFQPSQFYLQFHYQGLDQAPDQVVDRTHCQSQCHARLHPYHRSHSWRLSRKLSALICVLVVLITGCNTQTNATGTSRAGSANNQVEAKALNDTAYALIGKKQFEEALPLCRKAVALAPELAEVQKNLRTLYYPIFPVGQEYYLEP